MAQSSLNFNADEDEQDAEPGADAMPDSADDRGSSSIQSPNFQLAAASNPVGDAARSADATRSNASSGDDPSSDAQSAPSVQTDASQDSPSSQQFAQSAQPTPTMQAAGTPRQQSGAATDSGDALAQPGASDGASAPRQRQAVKQIGYIPDTDDAQILAQSKDLPTAWEQMAQQYEARRQQVAQINQSDPYVR